MGARTAFGRGVEAFWEGRAVRAVGDSTGHALRRRALRARHAALIDADGSREDEGTERETLLRARRGRGSARGPAPGAVRRRALGNRRRDDARRQRAPQEWLASRRREPTPVPRVETGALAARPRRTTRGARPRFHGLVACASGAAAIGLGAEWIRSGDADLVLAGGADAISPFVFSGFDALRALSTDGRAAVRRRARRSHAGRRGGLSSSSRRRGTPGGAERDPRARVGLRLGADAYHMTRPDLEAGGLVRAIEAALRKAGRTAVRRGLRERPRDRDDVQRRDGGGRSGACPRPSSRIVPVHGLKGAIGHTLGAAGALEAILSVLVLGAADVPPTAGHRRRVPIRRSSSSRAGRSSPPGRSTSRSRPRPRSGGRTRPSCWRGRNEETSCSRRRASVLAARPDGSGDANRLRRMDRFGRSGFLAGRAPSPPRASRGKNDLTPGYGVVVGTRHGCRSAITEHAALLAVGGACGGSRAVRLRGDGSQHRERRARHRPRPRRPRRDDRLGPDGGSRGADPRRAARRRRRRGPRSRRRGRGRRRRDARCVGRREICFGTPRYGSRAGRDGCGGASRGRRRFLRVERSPVRYVSGTQFFEPDARLASARFFEWLRTAEERAGGGAASPAVSLCRPDYEDFLEGNRGRER